MDAVDISGRDLGRTLLVGIPRHGADGYEEVVVGELVGVAHTASSVTAARHSHVRTRLTLESMGRTLEVEPKEDYELEWGHPQS
jgi:hypothetical protein